MRIAQPGEWPDSRPARRWPLDAELAPLWSVELATDLAPQLGPAHGELLVTDGRGQVWAVDASRPSLDAWPRATVPPGRFDSAWSSAPVYRTVDGTIYRWEPERKLRRVWHGGRGFGDGFAWGLPDERVLAGRQGGLWNRYFVDTRAGRVIWKRRADWWNLWVFDDVIVGLRGVQQDVVVAIEPESGELRWEREPGAGARLLGVVGGRLWLSMRAGGLFGIDLTSGQTQAHLESAPPAWPPLLDEEARCHLIVEDQYKVVALAGEARVVSQRFWDYGRGPVEGRPALLTSDGRMVLRDRRMALYAITPTPDDPRTRAPIEPFWSTPQLIVAIAAHAGHLFALTQDFPSDANQHRPRSAKLLCFGAP